MLCGFGTTKLHFFFRCGVQPAAQQISGVYKGLQEIRMCALKPPPDRGKILRLVQLINYRRAEFVGNKPLFQQRYAIFHRGEEAACTGGSVVFFARVFHIHGDIVYKPPLDQAPQLLREAAVCIELDAEAERLDLFEQCVNLR